MLIIASISPAARAIQGSPAASSLVVFSNLPNSVPVLDQRGARVASIDVFRGLTMLVMIFVNDLSGVTGLPWWTYHMPDKVNGMTYVDVVFPAFLFILGMSIPLALERRIALGDSTGALLGHIALRSGTLLALGVFLANSGRFDPGLAGMGATAWRLLGFAGILLALNVYPKDGGRQSLYRTCRLSGVLLFAVVLAIFRRRTNAGQSGWLDFSYVEILGLIGWAYLEAALLYLLGRKRFSLLAIFTIGLCVLNVLSTLGWLDWLGAARRYSPFESGLCFIAMAGVLASRIFFMEGRDNLRRLAGYGLALLAAGWAFSPLGISKNHDTPSWTLLCAGISVLLFLALHWIVDLRGFTGWTRPLRPAGANTLLTYLLPDIWYAIPALVALSGHWSVGAPGVLRSMAFTALMLAVSAALTKAGIRLRL